MNIVCTDEEQRLSSRIYERIEEAASKVYEQEICAWPAASPEEFRNRRMEPENSIPMESEDSIPISEEISDGNGNRLATESSDPDQMTGFTADSEDLADSPEEQIAGQLPDSQDYEEKTGTDSAGETGAYAYSSEEQVAGQLLDSQDCLEVSLTITDAEAIREINAAYRNVDQVTDVLSFPQYESAEEVREEILHCPDGCVIPLGDVVICMDRALEQAAEYGNTEEREVTYLFVHSMMHLLGYDHMEEEEKKIMRRHEESVMRAIGLERE